MSRKSFKIEEENLRLRNELKRLKTQIKQLKKTSNNISVLPPEYKNNLALRVQENLDLGIFSPPKIPARPKSPISTHSRKTSRSPSFVSSICMESNKENICQVKTQSPEFAKVKFIDQPIFTSQGTSYREPPTYRDPQTYCDQLSNLNDTSRQNIDELQTLERENNMLKELKNLRKENEILRSQMRLKTPKSISRTKSRKAVNKSKKFLSDLTDFESVTVSKKPTITSVKEQKNPVRSRKILENRVIGHKHSSSMISPSINKSRISRSPSLCSRSPNASFSDNFSFTGSAKKVKNSEVECLNMPRTFDKSICSNSSKFSPNVTPRSKHCWNCDDLLYKGLSTSFCSKTHED